MAANGPVDDASIGRFDQSFLIHMIKDFFVILIIVTVLEFALKAGLVWYDFKANGDDRAQEAASEIAQNVRSIMLNEGGPVAARTLYPILKKNWTERGYTIVVAPSPVTISSIETTFGYRPTGIAAAPEPETARAANAEVAIRAEEFCLGCHVHAEVDDTLGTVVVHSYLGTQFAAWWKSVQVGLGLAVGKIVLHSILLFVLLRARLEPLLRLRAVVSNLARAFGGLDQRAEVRSADEFGALARDLNLFLNRVDRLVQELGQVLHKVVAVHDDILILQTDLRGQVDDITRASRALERRALIGAKREPKLSPEWFGAIRGSVTRLDGLLATLPETDRQEATQLLETLEEVVAHAEAQIASNEALYADLIGLGERSEGLHRAMEHMIRLEERMDVIVETGTVLVDRLQSSAAQPTTTVPATRGSARPVTSPAE